MAVEGLVDDGGEIAAEAIEGREDELGVLAPCEAVVLEQVGVGEDHDGLALPQDLPQQDPLGARDEGDERARAEELRLVQGGRGQKADEAPQRGSGADHFRLQAEGKEDLLHFLPWQEVLGLDEAGRERVREPLALGEGQEQPRAVFRKLGKEALRAAVVLLHRGLEDEGGGAALGLLGGSVSGDDDGAAGGAQELQEGAMSQRGAAEGVGAGGGRFKEEVAEGCQGGGGEERCHGGRDEEGGGAAGECAPRQRDAPGVFPLGR